MNVSVVGLGKIGLPLAVQYASKGCTVYGIDINKESVEMINQGKTTIQNEKGLPEILKKVIESKKLTATTQYTSIENADVVIVIVPLVTAEDYSANYAIIDAATDSVGRHLKEGRGTTVIFETTFPIGTTRTRLIPKLETVSGLTCGKDFFVAYSPERVYSGRILEDLKEYPKIVGGVDEKSLNNAIEFYKKVLDTQIITTTLETAEATKLFEMVYRNVNIALANEFAKLSDKLGIDVMEAIRGANTISRYYHIHRPSCGVGGHCAPVYPHFLLQNAQSAGLDLELIRKATEVNDDMPFYTVQLLENEIHTLKGKRVLVLGLAYRGNVKETFKSPALDIVKALIDNQAHVFLHDPYFSSEEIKRTGAMRAEDMYQQYDAIILTAMHKEYETLDFKRLKANGVSVFLDGLNAFPRKMVEDAGITYKGIGV